MQTLKNEQQHWVASRDQYAEEIAAEAEGGSMYPMLYADAQAEATKARVYELAELLK